MAAAPYFDLVREMTDTYNHRLRLVQHARQHGIKPTARAFATTVPTVRKWLHRFQQHGPSGLREHSRETADWRKMAPRLNQCRVILGF
jgi:transposase-like protein